jgi:anhydro-N-acetylmuramic acid kinase
MRILGMISGTSHDGIDLAVVAFTHDGGTLTGTIEYAVTVPYSQRLRSKLIAALPPTPAVCSITNFS